MNTKITDPYVICPVYETQSFKYRQVRVEDAADLFECYKDPQAFPLFNSDNCHSDFRISTLEEMEAYITSWLVEYQNRAYVRLSIVDKLNGKAVGTIEFFCRAGMSGEKRLTGILRIDIASDYETENYLYEIIKLVEDYFHYGFEFTTILTKAIPLAEPRIRALKSCGYQSVERSTVMPYDHYYIKDLTRSL